MILKNRDPKQNWPYRPWHPRRSAAVAQWVDYRPPHHDTVASRMFAMFVVTALIGVCITVLICIAVARPHRSDLASRAAVVSFEAKNAESGE